MASDMAGPTKERLWGCEIGVLGRGVWEGLFLRAEEDHLEEDAAPEFGKGRGA